MKKNNTKQRIVIVVGFAIFLSLLILSNDPPAKSATYDTGQIIRLGTFLQIKVHCKDEQVAQLAISQAIETVDRLERLISTYLPESQLSQVNQKAGMDYVAISPEVFELLKRGQYYHRLTDGALDMSVQPLLDLWQEAQEDDIYPSIETIKMAIDLIGYDKVVLSDGSKTTAKLTHKGAAINVNAFAKGYIVDQAILALKIDGVIGGLVNIGGEIACFGSWESGRDFTLGIQDPFSAETDNPFSEKPRWIVNLKEGAIATSGNYRQYVNIQGKKYSHIIDPRTGKPADILPSVTVIAPRCIDADALATALSVLGPEKGLELIETLENTEALLVAAPEEDSSAIPIIYQSTGWNKYEAK